MRFTVRPGTDPGGRADAAILAAMGLPGGGILRVGNTHVVVRPGDVASPNALLLDPTTMENAGVGAGADVRAERAVLSQAQRVVVESTGTAIEARHLARSIQGIAVTAGDIVIVRPNYGEGTPDPIRMRVVSVEPDGLGIVGSATVVAEEGEATEAVMAQPAGHPRGEAPTTAQALLAGLDTELDTMTGWLSLLTSTGDLPGAWGLPRVAGVLLAGPAGCGKSELVAAAAARAGAAVHEVSLELVFKPEKLLDLLEKAVHQTPVPSVVFVDRLDSVAGDEAMFRNQVAAILRWFLDAVAGKPRLACVLGVSSVTKLADTVSDSPLLPRTLSIPPPDLERRRLFFEAALARVPVADDVDYSVLASRTAGFSGADILACVLHASALIAPSGASVTADVLATAIREATPSLGTASLGEIPSYGFERVANLDEVKQRLTETVVWQLTDPTRFDRLGIEPPRGMLLYGPPGTGKTFVIRALAHEAGAAFFTVKGAELLDKYVGESERGVREIFARARAVAPAIIFFDEIDALAPVRGNSTNSVTDSVVAALLTEMDGVADRGDVFVIGATNRKDLIDPALLRAGRLETHLELGLPPAPSRRAFFEISDVPLAEDVDIERVITATEGMSFADLSGLLREAALQALRRDGQALAVTAADLDAAVARLAPTP